MLQTIVSNNAAVRGASPCAAATTTAHVAVVPTAPCTVYAVTTSTTSPSATTLNKIPP